MANTFSEKYFLPRFVAGGESAAPPVSADAGMPAALREEGRALVLDETAAIEDNMRRGADSASLVLIF
ncbi:hypothetical protein QUW15_01875 [Desulfovibrio piger]|nr:hypothetical protein [Desulfovibrio piger]